MKSKIPNFKVVVRVWRQILFPGDLHDVAVQFSVEALIALTPHHA